MQIEENRSGCITRIVYGCVIATQMHNKEPLIWNEHKQQKGYNVGNKHQTAFLILSMGSIYIYAW